MSEKALPKLRALDIRPIPQPGGSGRGQRSLWLRDPLELCEKSVVVPMQLAPLLALCDGTRDASSLRASAAVRYGLPLSAAVVEQFLQALDDACLLENEHHLEAYARALAAYRSAPFRPPALAGTSYPEEKGALRQQLESYEQTAQQASGSTETAEDDLRGLIGPHIDYMRGGPVYARVWNQAAPSVREADLVVLLGTDHSGGPERITLTRQHYATPFGVLPTDTAVVDALAQAIGEDEAYAEELHHRSEHSIELSAVWLHHVRDGASCAVVPILCGSYAGYTDGDGDPSEDIKIAALLGALETATAGKRVLIVASVDLSHVGPAFGGRPVNLGGRARVQADDDEIIARTCEGDADGFFAAIKRKGNANNVCGLPPIYLALRALAPVRGDLVAYDRCPADERNASWVTVCGITLR